MKKSILRLSVFLWASLILVSLMFPADTGEFGLKDILSYSFPSNLQVSPKADLVAWVFNSQGKRNIWIARGPEYKAKPVTSYNEDDGQEIGELEFNHDGTLLLYVRGGAENRSSENPNPTSNPEGVEQAVWAVNLNNGSLWRIGRGSSPLCSPTENKMAFGYHGDVYISDIKEDSRPRYLFKARGRNSAQEWSPDGSKLAFVSQRDDHSFIGIYDFTEKSISWVDPSVGRDGYPVWSPCGKYVAFIRFLGDTGSSFQGGIKFKIMLADIHSKKATTIWECPNATGGFAQYYPSETLRWADDSHLVFYSEHEKWMHLYSFSLKKNKLISLTPGDYEVEDSFLSLDKKQLLFNSNKDDTDRRHIWSVPVSGGKSQCLTKGNGIEWSPVLTPDSKDLVFICSSATQPAAPAYKKQLQDESRLMASELISDVFSSKKLVNPQ